MTAKLRAVVLIAILLVAAPVARAASTILVTVPARTWTDLGAGPLIVETDDRSSQVRFAISDQSPTSSQVGFLNVRTFQTPSHVWAYSVPAAGVTVAPIAASASGGGSGGAAPPVPLASGLGGTFGDTLGTAVTNDFIPPAGSNPYKSITVTNQSSLNTLTTVTVCGIGVANRKGNLITPATDAGGCYTFGPKGHYSAPAGGYVPQDGLNALASAPNTPVTVELH